MRQVFRPWRAAWRDTYLLFSQFAWQLALFTLVIVGGGVAYFFLAQSANEPIKTLAEAIYAALGMAFLQNAETFPQTWYLQLFFFGMPLATLAILAQGLADFGVMLFNRRARSKEWEVAVASTFNNHIILVGLGHLGFRVVQQLHSMNQDVVVVELNPEEDLVANAQSLGVPVVQGDATREFILESAGVRKARVIVLCSQNDNTNLQIGVKSRSLNPSIKVIVRIFDDDFAQALQKQFNFTALSATGMAAPIFAAIAAGMDITQPISVEGQAFSLARFNIGAGSKLVGATVNAIEEKHRVSIVLLRRDSVSEFHPAGDRVLSVNDLVAVLGEPEQILKLAQENK
jgi:Trk K+ transport system NAD-binding subunit